MIKTEYFFLIVTIMFFNSTSWQKKDPLLVQRVFEIIVIKGYLTLTVTDLLFWDQANGVDSEFTGLSLP